MGKRKPVVSQSRKRMLEASTTIFTEAEVFHMLTKGLKSKSARRGLEFDEDCLVEIKNQIASRKECPILGIPFDWRQGQHLPFRHSLDRVDNTLGYIPNNVSVISNFANRMKYTWSQHTFEYAMKCGAEHLKRLEELLADKDQGELDL